MGFKHDCHLASKLERSSGVLTSWMTAGLEWTLLRGRQTPLIEVYCSPYLRQRHRRAPTRTLRPEAEVLDAMFPAHEVHMTRLCMLVRPSPRRLHGFCMCIATSIALLTDRPTALEAVLTFFNIEGLCFLVLQRIARHLIIAVSCLEESSGEPSRSSSCCCWLL